MSICTSGRTVQPRFLCTRIAIGLVVRELGDQPPEVLSCMGRVLVAHWSRTQVTVALSSAEAELNAAVKAACEAIGMKQLCGHLGMPVTTKMFGDSSAMKGTLSRKGSGKVKHLETRQLWLQEHIASGNVVLLKVHRDLNPADALTHFWCKADGIKHFS